MAPPPSTFYRASVPARARDHVTTDELLAATKATRDTLYRWVAQKLLPRPRIVTDASGHQFAAWVPDASHAHASSSPARARA